jgi:hypothetical protein
VPIEDAANVSILISTEDVTGGYAGRHTSRLGDVNKDGLDDFAFGAYKDSEGGYGAGQVFVFFGRNANQWPSTPTTVYASDYANASYLGKPDPDAPGVGENAGFSVSGAGDINGDGYDDILIGAANGHASIRGKAYVIFGRANGWVMDQSLSLANLTITGDYPHDLTGLDSFFAFDVSGIGDINNDDYADFSISAPFVNNLKGIVFVIFGGKWTNPDPPDPPPISSSISSSTSTSTSTSKSSSTTLPAPIILILSLTVVSILRKRMDKCVQYRRIPLLRKR